MNSVTLKQLRYFEALARHRHFGHAADACAISQPALSMQIRELETGLGMTLFERGPRHVSLTGFGVQFAQKAREILRSVEELGDLARAAQNDLVGRLRIGIIPTVAPYLLPRIVSELSERHPALDINLRETITPRLLEDIAEGRLDTAIVALPVSEPALHEEPLFTEEFVLVRPFGDAGKPVPNRETLRSMRLLLLEEGHCFRDQALSFCDMRLSSPREILDGSTLSTLVQMVGAGIGVTLIPEIAVPIETNAAKVAINRFPEPRPRRTVGMVWRKSSPLGEQYVHIAGTVRDAAAANLT